MWGRLLAGFIAAARSLTPGRLIASYTLLLLAIVAVLFLNDDLHPLMAVALIPMLLAAAYYRSRVYLVLAAEYSVVGAFSILFLDEYSGYPIILALAYFPTFLFIAELLHRLTAARSRAEDALAFEHYLLHALMENLPDSIYFKDRESKFTRINKNLAMDVGLVGPEEAIGKSDFDLFSKELAKASLEDEQRIVETGVPILAKEEREIWPDGHETWVLTTKMPLWDSEGQVAGTFGVSRDITERKQSEQALARLAAIVESSDDAIFSVTLDATITSWNAGAERLFGYTTAEMIGKSASLLIPIDSTSEYADNLDLIRQGRNVLPYETVRQAKDGRLVDVSLAISPMKDSSGTIFGASAIVRDISEHKRIEELRRATEVAEQANRTKSEFLSRMSHEFRTPLNAILGFTELVQMDGVRADQHEHLDLVLKAGRRLLGLVDEVLEISRIDQNRLRIFIEPVSIGAVLHECVDAMQPLASEYSVEMVANIPLGGDPLLGGPYISADRRHLHQAILNLLSNAIKYNSPGGSVTISYTEEPATIHPTPTTGSPTEGSTANRLRISISDTGPGISPQKLARLFTPFDRLGAENSPIEGTGLGLALSQRLVEAMSGTIGVESKMGEGSTFWIEFATTERPTNPNDL